MAKAPVSFPPGTFRASAKVTHERKVDSDDESPQKYSHELFTEYQFGEDGNYMMHGYPPISEKGKVVVHEKVGHEYRCRITQRVQTSAKGEWKPADIEALIRFSGDLKSFVWDAKTYYTPDARVAAEKKEEQKDEKKDETKEDAKVRRSKKDKKP